MDGTGSDSIGADSELISRLRIIESQPLADRAEAYGALHEELARRLESGPTDRPAPRG